MQASSISFYRLLSSAGYVYINSFFHDHIFVSESFAKKMNIASSFEMFCQKAISSLYQFDSVLLCQPPHLVQSGIDFYEAKLNMLMTENHSRVADYYSYVTGGLSCCLNLLHKMGKQDEHYSIKLRQAGFEL